jgi:hypothetical protein
MTTMKNTAALIALLIALAGSGAQIARSASQVVETARTEQV